LPLGTVFAICIIKELSKISDSQKRIVMKKVKIFFTFSLLIFLSITILAQQGNEEKLNLPGDNLNLYAVMKLFQESETLEGFEKNLNAEESKINNLDLNADNKIDYIKVLDYVDGDDHTIVLQVAVNGSENQDVAVFTVQKDDKNQVQVQLVGDEELYGKDYIIEPNYAEVASGETPNPGYAAKSTTVEKETVVVKKTTYVEVAAWPVVTYIYTPAYVVYRSPWYWGYYPPYWSPWSPFYWDYYYGYHSHFHSHYYSHYNHCHYYRYPHYNDYYYHMHRNYSNTVYHHRQSGTYRNTYSHPETRNQGSADFMKRYPNGYPTARPATNSGSNANRPAARPGTSENVRRPATTPASDINKVKPAGEPGNVSPSNRPGTAKPGMNQPSSRPGNATPNARPVTTKPSPGKPTTRPVNVTQPTRPSPAKPASKPTTGKYVSKSGNTSRPEHPSSVKPNFNHGKSGTLPKQNSSRPSNPPSKTNSKKTGGSR